ncbi:MAG: hypothetical protein AB7I37_08355 [Pirellulales bacterium]
MSDSETVAAIRSQTLAAMAAMTADPKPSYSIDGQSVAWSEYLARLQATVDWCDRKLADEEPFEVHTVGRT